VEVLESGLDLKQKKQRVDLGESAFSLMVTPAAAILLPQS
jgi:hypothetical protein